MKLNNSELETEIKNGDNNYSDEVDFDSQLKNIIIKKGKLIKYLSVIYFLAIMLSFAFYILS